MCAVMASSTQGFHVLVGMLGRAPPKIKYYKCYVCMTILKLCFLESNIKQFENRGVHIKSNQIIQYIMI
jgi:Pyruvate/2-oxoacid:ferredoxin oxidoreductase delta subunit